MRATRLERYKKDCEERAGKLLDEITVAAKAAGVEYEGTHVTANHPYEGIIDTATLRGCDLMLMASHGRKGARASCWQRNPQGLIHSKIPVLVSR